jgi:hypothetical protein
MKFFIPLIYPQHNSPLFLLPDKTAYKCNAGCKFEVQNQIPRFVPLDNYASSFGLHQWAILDTQDTLTNHFKHLKSAEEIQDILHSCGMVDIQTIYAGNGVEARAIKE